MDRISVESIQFNTVYTDSKLSLRAFSKLFDMSHVSISRMLKGIQPINIDVVNIVCYKLGYSPEWFINGKGPKRKKPSESDPQSDITMLRSELAIMAAKNAALESRIMALEQDILEHDSQFKIIIEHFNANTKADIIQQTTKRTRLTKEK